VEYSYLLTSAKITNIKEATDFKLHIDIFF